MLRIAITHERPAIDHAGREHRGVLAGAVVVQSIGVTTRPDDFARRCF